MMLTGQKIAELRTLAEMTQEQLAEKLFVSRELVSKWETGKRRPDHDTILRLSELFSVEPGALIDRDQAMMEELSDGLPDGALTMERLNSFLGTLKERDRCVFVRRYYFMEDSAEIARNYAISQAYVRTVLMRTRRKLRSFMKEGQQ